MAERVQHAQFRLRSISIKVPIMPAWSAERFDFLEKS